MKSHLRGGFGFLFRLVVLLHICFDRAVETNPSTVKTKSYLTQNLRNQCEMVASPFGVQIEKKQADLMVELNSYCCILCTLLRFHTSIYLTKGMI